MLKHCSPSSVDIRRRSRRNLLTIVDNADVGSDIVVTDHVYDCEYNKEDDYAVPYDLRADEDLELNEDDIEFDTTSIRSSYSTNTTSDSSSSSISTIQNYQNHHKVHLSSCNGHQNHQHHCHHKGKGNRHVKRHNNRNCSSTNRSSTNSSSSAASTINSSHRVILSLSSDESCISSIPNPNKASSASHTKPSVKTNLSQFYQPRATNQKTPFITSNLSPSDATAIDNNGMKTETVEYSFINNPIQISSCGITKTLITSQPSPQKTISGPPLTNQCDKNPQNMCKNSNLSPKKISSQMFGLSDASPPHGQQKSFASSSPAKAKDTSSPAAKLKSPEQQQNINKMAIKIYSRCLSSDIEYKTLSVNHQTTSKEVIWMLLSKFKMRHRDPKLFHLTMDINIKRTGIPLRRTLSLDDDSRPAELKSCHPWGECRFTLQMRKGGLVRIHASVLMPESKYKCLLISEQTTAKEVIKILFHCYGLMEKETFCLDQFCLYEQCPSQAYERRLHPDDQPVPLQSMWPTLQSTSSTATENQFAFVLKKVSAQQLSNECNDLMMYSLPGDHRYSPQTVYNINRNRSKFQCSDILEEEDAIELNDLVEDVIVDEVVTSVDDDNDNDVDIEGEDINILTAGNRIKNSQPNENESNNNLHEQECSRNDNTGGMNPPGHQLDTSYSSSGECSTASSEYSALRFRDSPMSSSSRSRTSTDSSSMATTPSSGKETSSTTDSLLIDTPNKNSAKSASHLSFNQKPAFTLNDDFSGTSAPFHRRLFNSQKPNNMTQLNLNPNNILSENSTSVKPNLKLASDQADNVNSLPLDHHHFSLHSLLEALPAASVDTNNLCEGQSPKHKRDGERLNKRSSIGSLSTDGSRASGEFDGFFYI